MKFLPFRKSQDIYVYIRIFIDLKFSVDLLFDAYLPWSVLWMLCACACRLASSQNPSKNNFILHWSFFNQEFCLECCIAGNI